MQLGLVMMALGTFRFGISNGAYQKLDRRAAYRWGAVNPIGQEPTQHYGGPGSQDITIGGVIYPHFKGGLRQVDLMRLQAGLGRPFMMVDGLGWIWKKWVIISVDEKKTFFMRDGAPRKIEFTLTLRSYGTDRKDPVAAIGGLL